MFSRQKCSSPTILRTMSRARPIALALAPVGLAVLAACGSGGGIEDLALEPVATAAPAIDTAVTAPAATAAPAPPATAIAVATPIPTLAPPTPLPTPTATPIPPRTGNIEYTVVGGDVLGLIAERYDVTQRQILDVNDGMSASVLSVGQVIVIPPSGGDTNEGTDSGSDSGADSGSDSGSDTGTADATATPRPQATVAPVDTTGRNSTAVFTHEVASGQFLGTIADAFGVTVSDLVLYNGLSSADSIFVGQNILIPPAGTTVTGPVSGGTAATATPAATADPNATATVAPTADPNATATVAPTVDASQTTPTLTPTPTPTVDPNVTATVAPTSEVPTPLPTSTAIPCNEVLFPSCSGV